MTDLDKAKELVDFFDTPEVKKMRAAHEEWEHDCDRAYKRLPVGDKLMMLQAICKIITDTERKGTSHRGLMNALGVYPDGFNVLDLMHIHNALFTEFHGNALRQVSLGDTGCGSSDSKTSQSK